MVSVGIPRGLLYYQYYPMWKGFFESLGAKVVLSATTTRRIVADGASRVVAETCLPVKIFCGQVASLAGRCDYVFIPALRSVEPNAYNCSKLLGLPDLVKAVVPEAPPILDVDIDVTRGKRDLYLAIYGLGRAFTWNPLRVKEAAEAAWQTHLHYRERMWREQLTHLEVLAEEEAKEKEVKKNGAAPVATIAVIGHPYLIYDEYINHRLLRRLRSMGVKVVTTEMAPEKDLDEAIARLIGQAYWSFEDEMLGAGCYYLDKAGVDGVIGVVAFGCGPDSVMLDMVKRHARRQGLRPFMALVIDEHTAEAGLITRLEAFLDMLLRRKKRACG